MHALTQEPSSVPNPKVVLETRHSHESLIKCSTHEHPAETFALIRGLDTEVPDAP